MQPSAAGLAPHDRALVGRRSSAGRRGRAEWLLPAPSRASRCA